MFGKLSAISLYSNKPVFGRVCVQEHLKKQLRQTEARIEWLVKLEGRPYTLNTHYLSDYTEKFLAYYKEARGKAGTQRLGLRTRSVYSRFFSSLMNGD